MSIELNEEQRDIIQCSFDMKEREILKIQAYAGSGKTTILKEIASAHHSSSFLYLSFNKAIANEASKIFPENVKVSTTHSLAYRYIVSRNKNFKIVNDYSVFDLCKILDTQDFEEVMIFKSHLKDFLYSSSSLFPNKKVGKFFEKACAGIIPLTHDVYLKMFQLLLREEKLLSEYDFILLDEAQDTNAVTLDIFLNNECKKILVGDSFQNIYSFRGTVDALSIVKAKYEKSLSYTFRTEESIVKKVNFFLEKYAYNFNCELKSSYKKKDDEYSIAYITRTNASLIEMIADIYFQKSDLKAEEVSLIKEPSSIFEMSINIYYFLNDKDKISKSFKWLLNFSDKNELKNYAKECMDIEVEYSVKLVNKYEDKIFDLFDLAKELYNNKNYKICFSNAHLSKGLEWNEVHLHNDFPHLYSLQKDVKSAKQHKQRQKLKEAFVCERNLYYVAMTRSKDILIDKTPNNKEYLQELEMFNLEKKDKNFKILRHTRQ